MDLATKRLCLFCRKLEPKDKLCPWLQSQPKTPITPTFNGNQQIISEAWTPQDDGLLKTLRQQPSALCQRCSDFDILHRFKNVNPLDHQQCELFSRLEDAAYYELRSPTQMPLGLLSTFFLTPSCPLCRLIYRISSRPPPDHDNSVLALDPYRWYLRYDGWESIPTETKQSYAVFFGIASPDVQGRTGASPYIDGSFRAAARPGEAIALLPDRGSSVKTAYEALSISQTIDFTPIRAALDYCTTSHPSVCQPRFEKGLLETMMVDVNRREVVPCPDQCDYVALSYVWGGVHPTINALQAGTLPQTIEDAITVTKKLGRRYLWVDALCIDQTPNPTPRQAAAKQKQLDLMHFIYSCAAVTLCVTSGENSNWGIPGVSRKRISSAQEVIEGVTLCSVPADITKEVERSVWNTRAWTFQEQTLSARRLYFTETQYMLQCGETIGPGHFSEVCDQVLDMRLSVIRGPRDYVEEQKYASKRVAEVYYGSIMEYTSRKMTNESDSINALQGILNRFQMEHVFRSTPLFGLPLKDVPYSLGWFHGYAVKPKRRLDFPSWSWAGWEGVVRYPPLLPPDPDVKLDLLPQVEGLRDKELTIRGWVVTLDIRTDPFSEVVIPGTQKSIGCVNERNFRHNNTLPSGRYRCLVVARVKEGVLKNGLDNQTIFLVVSSTNAAQLTERRTFVTISRLAHDGKDFMELGPQLEEVTIV